MTKKKRSGILGMGWEWDFAAIGLALGVLSFFIKRPPPPVTIPPF